MVYGKGGDGVVGPGNSMQDEPVGPGENKTSSSGDLSKRQGLITVNDLVYVLEPDLSVATNKTHKVQYFQNNEYNSGANAICILNSGADYIDTRRSWLQFDVQCSGTTPDTTFTTPGNPTTAVVLGKTSLYLGATGSACNFINQVTISTRSGDVLCQLFDYNLLQNIMLPLTYDKQWFDTVGQTMMYGGGLDTSTLTTRNRMCIPMYILAPLFGYGRLMPAMLMSGLRIEIQWANSQQAFQSIRTGQYIAPGNGADAAIASTADLSPLLPHWKTVKEGTVAAYTVHDAQLVMSSVQLSDSIQRSLNELSATNGLEIVYPDYERTSTAIGSGRELNIEVRKSCSRALKAFGRLRFNNFDPASGIGDEQNVDSFRAERSFPFYEYQWQLGSLYFPQQQVRSKNNGFVGAREIAPITYNMLLESFDSYHGAKSVVLPYHRVRETQAPFYGGQRVASQEIGVFEANYSNTGYHDGEFVPENPSSPGEQGSFKNDAHSIGVTLERSTMFNLAGVPVNNSRVLAFHARLVEGTTNFSGEVKTPTVDATTGEVTNPAVKVTVPSRNFTIFLKYVKLCRVFLNNVEVEQ